MFVVVGALGCAAAGLRDTGADCMPKSDSRAKRTSDLEAKKGVGGGFGGEVMVVEGNLFVSVDKRWEVCDDLVMSLVAN